MVNLLLFKFTFASLNLITSIGGGYLPTLLSNHLGSFTYANCFSGGVLLGVSMLHMLSEAAEDWIEETSEIDSHSHSYPLEFFVCGFGVLVSLFIAKCLYSETSHNHSHSLHQYEHDNEHDNEHEMSTLTNPNVSKSSSIPYLILIPMIFECFFAGVSLGVERTLKGATTIFIAIVSHIWTESFVLVTASMRCQFDSWRQRKILVLFSISNPLGTLAGILFDQYGFSTTKGTILVRSFCAGLFLYIALVDLIPEEISSRQGNKILKFLSVLTGYSLLAVVALAHG
eukprot:c12019_g1_i1.p1 GENE.c12019_g1_i1~~c12019_g1_i1.p1  ORF type:complete len:285 (-),score=80.51 c12019_g1_i1:36-890(-)